MSSEALKIDNEPAPAEKPVKRSGGKAPAWEGFREQSYLWRALFLLQLPAAALSLAAALMMYFYADTILEVKERPTPGYQSVAKLSNSHFIDAATTVVNLIATYQPAIARRQFKIARRYFEREALVEFEESIMAREAQVIEETRRSQIFYINQQAISVQRAEDGSHVIVRIPGIRQEYIGPRAKPPSMIGYSLKLTTIPEVTTNEYGIVVAGLGFGPLGDQ